MGRMFMQIVHKYAALPKGLFVKAVGDGAVDGADAGFVHLHHFAVVGHQAVHFRFDIRGLCIDTYESVSSLASL